MVCDEFKHRGHATTRREKGDFYTYDVSGKRTVWRNELCGISICHVDN